MIALRAKLLSAHPQCYPSVGVIEGWEFSWVKPVLRTEPMSESETVRERGARLVRDRPDVVREGPPCYPNGATIRGPRLVDRRAHRVADEFPDYGRLNPRREEEPIPGLSGGRVRPGEDPPSFRPRRGHGGRPIRRVHAALVRRHAREFLPGAPRVARTKRDRRTPPIPRGRLALVRKLDLRPRIFAPESPRAFDHAHLRRRQPGGLFLHRPATRRDLELHSRVRVEVPVRARLPP